MNDLRVDHFLQRACLAILLLLAGLQKADAQYQVFIKDPVYVQTAAGHVQDPTGGEIDDAMIELLDARTSELLASTVTDKKGNFAFKDFRRSSYKLKIARSGFNPVIVTINIRKTNTNPAIFTLPIAH